MRNKKAKAIRNTVKDMFPTRSPTTYALNEFNNSVELGNCQRRYYQQLKSIVKAGKK